MDGLHHELLLKIAKGLSHKEDLANFRLASKDCHAAVEEVAVRLSPMNGINNRQLLKVCPYSIGIKLTGLSSSSLLH